MCILFGDALLFIILTWYFDHVNESNRGRGDSFLFPFKRVYQFFVKNKKKSNKVAKHEESAYKSANYLVHDEE